MAKFLGKDDATKPQDFITALAQLQAACGVAELKMSDYGITAEEFTKIAQNARETMGRLFDADPAPLSQDDVVEILKKSYK
jgi:alcohol dehydrogenase